jgi:hypothetical protein
MNSNPQFQKFSSSLSAILTGIEVNEFIYFNVFYLYVHHPGDI